VGEETGSGFFELMHTLEKQSDLVLSGLQGCFFLFQAGGEGVELSVGKGGGGQRGERMVD
jgi:hypothetical protein